jgi:inorganic phosphate transporter, PiT family
MRPLPLALYSEAGGLLNMGQKITKLKPFEGFCAETAGALTLFGATHFGIPVSTTHTITGSIMGAGSTKGHQQSKGALQRNILAWILTIPVSAVFGASIFFLISSL